MRLSFTKALFPKVLLSLTALFVLAACDAKTVIRGNLPREHQLAAIKVDVSEARDIKQVLGTPSTIGSFDSNVWYYMGWQTEQWAFLSPEITNYGVHVFIFDDQSILKEHKLYTKDDLRDITLNPDKTPTAGIELSIIEQLFGNLKRLGVGK